jgi:hypothetical protein
MAKKQWIIKIDNCFVGGVDRLVDDKINAHKWHYKKRANIEACFWALRCIGTPFKVTVIPSE